MVSLGLSLYVCQVTASWGVTMDFSQAAQGRCCQLPRAEQRLVLIIFDCLSNLCIRRKFLEKEYVEGKIPLASDTYVFLRGHFIVSRPLREGGPL